MKEHPFSNLLLPANVDAAQSSGHEQVRERPLQLLPALAQQSFPPRSPPMRRRLPYVAFCASPLPVHFRRPRVGSLT